MAIVHAIDQTFEQEISNGVVLVTFGQLGADHV